MEEKNDTAVSAEELQAEQEALKEAKEDEVRSKVIEEYGFDELDDAERIDKLVKERVGFYQTKASLTKQKVKHRTEAEELRKKVPAAPADTKTADATPDIRKAVAEELEKRDLQALEYSDDLKKEIQRIAQAKGVSVKEAVRDPYIAYKIDAYTKEQTANEAAISRTNRSGGSKEYTLDNPPDVDMSTEEGRKAWDSYTEGLKKKGV